MSQLTVREMLAELRRRGVAEILEEAPDFLAKITAKVLEVDGARLFNEAPELAGDFMNAFWEGVGVLGDGDTPLRSALNRVTMPMHVNMEASDSPLNGHFIVGCGKLSGGSGLLHFREEDYRFMGPTEILLRLLLGELPLGTYNLQLQTAGHSGFAARIGPVLKGISGSIHGKEDG
jgi:hypothetical protein